MSSQGNPSSILNVVYRSLHHSEAQKRDNSLRGSSTIRSSAILPSVGLNGQAEQVEYAIRGRSRESRFRLAYRLSAVFCKSGSCARMDVNAGDSTKLNARPSAALMIGAEKNRRAMFRIRLACKTDCFGLLPTQLCFRVTVHLPKKRANY